MQDFMLEEKDDPLKPSNRVLVVDINDLIVDLVDEEDSASILIVDDDMINLELHESMIN